MNVEMKTYHIHPMYFTLSFINADAGANSVKSYKLSPNEHFTLDIQNGGDQSLSAELVLQKALDREKQAVIELTLTAIDGGKPPKTGNVQIQVNVLDVNDNSPVFSKSLYKVQVSENENAGTTLLALSATDLDDGVNGQIVYSFTEKRRFNPDDVFSLNESTGEIKVKGNIDYEENQAYEIRVQARDKGTPPRSAHSKILVEVIDVNDNAPEISVSSIMSPVKEDAEIGTVVAMVTITDHDGGKNGLTYCKIIGSLPFKLKSNYKNYYSLLVDGPLDRESVSQFNVSIIATDEGIPSLSSTSVINVKVSDVNDNPPRFLGPVINVYVKENSPIGNTIHILTTLDSDLNENAKATYHLINSSPKETQISSIININSETGDIVSLQSFNYENIKTFQFKVQILVEVIDVNDNAPEISVSSVMSPVKEDAEIGTVVAMLTITDRDGGKNGLTYCKIIGSLPFKLKSNYKNYYSLLVDGPLDRESVSQFNVSIIATDEGIPSLSSTSVINVKVSDVNDNPPRFLGPVINVYVKENSPIGNTIHILTTLDSDLNENAKATYHLINSSPKETQISSIININSETGDIVSLQSFNYENIKTFQFKVQATDSGVPPLSSNVTVNVLVLDENDNSPTILLPYSEHGSVNSESIPYSAEAGYFVAKIRAVDADSGYNALLSYHLSEPKGNNLFRIGTSTGEIRTKRRMSDNDLKTHPLVVLVSDNGEPSLSATVSIDVVVVESTADIQTQFRHVPLKEDSFSDLNLYLLIAIVSVSVIFLLSLVILIAVKCHRTDVESLSLVEIQLLVLKT
uniref:Cadherin domain-containing protein n=1 Tax=Gasterosteus aculeatus aculeatus TaxID=481459 RepID=A0AAQ4RL66_GASAC